MKSLGGDLVVYSASRVGTYAQSEYHIHTAYTISSGDDKGVQHIVNRAGSVN